MPIDRVGQEIAGIEGKVSGLVQVLGPAPTNTKATATPQLLARTTPAAPPTPTAEAELPLSAPEADLVVDAGEGELFTAEPSPAETDLNTGVETNGRPSRPPPPPRPRRRPRRPPCRPRQPPPPCRRRQPYLHRRRLQRRWPETRRTRIVFNRAIPYQGSRSASMSASMRCLPPIASPLTQPCASVRNL